MLRILRVHAQARTARVLIGKQHALPVRAAIRGAKNAALLLWPGSAAHRAREDDVRIRGMHDDPADAAGFVQPHVRPRLAGVGGFIDAVAHHIAVADDPGLAGPRPNDVGIGGRHRKSSDCLHRLAIEDRTPIVAAIAGFPDAARRRARVVSGGIAGHAGDRGDAVADNWSHKTEAEAVRSGSSAAPLGLQKDTCERQKHGIPIARIHVYLLCGSVGPIHGVAVNPRHRHLAIQ